MWSPTKSTRSLLCHPEPPATLEKGRGPNRGGLLVTWRCLWDAFKYEYKVLSNGDSTAAVLAVQRAV